MARSLGDALRVPPGAVDLAALDARATPLAPEAISADLSRSRS
jgi:hypothetical protein